MAHGTQLIGMRVLMVDDELIAQTATGRAARALVAELTNRDIAVVEAISTDDGRVVVETDPSIQAILLDWVLSDDPEHSKARELISLVRRRNAQIPIFLVVPHGDRSSIPAEIMREVDELVVLLEDTPFFIAGRVLSAVLRYRDSMAPPFMKALLSFAQDYEYSWHTPGHAGGLAFLKSPIGQVFHAYFGENLLRSDLSISVGELGSLLDHSGPIGESENYAARVVGADWCFTVTNGSSMSNRVIMMASVTRGDYALCDRNAHKSTEQALTMSGAIPTYLQPSRNYLGIMGPICTRHLRPEAVRDAIQKNPLAVDKRQSPVHAIVTNSTYDGLTYHVPTVIDLLGQSVDRIHFDEAWYGYAHFNPLYAHRFGMCDAPTPDEAPKRPTIFTTTSTHKLLAALSQASLISVRKGRRPIDKPLFNEAYMMHASTSPQYAIIASNEVAMAMMDGPGGRTLTTEAISEAIAFRKAIRRLHRQAWRADDWFVDVWNADVVTDSKTRHKYAFEDAPDELLISDPNCWVLHPGDEWHGFNDLDEGYCMLDPIKVSIVTPGALPDGSLDPKGIPAMILSAYLDQRGIVVEKTTDFTILFLFSIGVTKAKYGTLINALLRFKEDFDRNAPLVEVLPNLVAAQPAKTYDKDGLKDLARKMIEQMRASSQMEYQAQAFNEPPTACCTPADAYSRLVHGEVALVPVDEMADRIVATGVVPYPPGIPLLMPGENAGKIDEAYLKYLQALQAWDNRFPGFAHDIHGVENVEGKYMIYCLNA